MIDAISPDLKSTLKRLKLGPLLDTLPDRLTLARQQKIPHAAPTSGWRPSPTRSAPRRRSTASRVTPTTW